MTIHAKHVQPKKALEVKRKSEKKNGITACSYYGAVFIPITLVQCHNLASVADKHEITAMTIDTYH